MAEKKLTPAGWATELGTRLYRAAMKKAGLPIDKPLTKKEYEKAFEEWAKTPVPAKVLPKPSVVAESMIAKGQAHRGPPKEELKPDEKPSQEPPKATKPKGGEK